jgi:hypothetical protein
VEKTNEPLNLKITHGLERDKVHIRWGSRCSLRSMKTEFGAKMKEWLTPPNKRVFRIQREQIVQNLL